MNKQVVGALRAILLGVLACDGSTDVCLSKPTAAVQVNVYDARTGQPAAFQATLVVRDGAFVDSTTGRYSGSDAAAARLLAAADRPGIYSATVRKAGYTEWQQSNIVVAMGECSVKTAVFRVDLPPL